MRNLSDIKFKFWLPNKKEMKGQFSLWAIYMNGEECYGYRFSLDDDFRYLFSVKNLAFQKGFNFTLYDDLNIPLQFTGLHDSEDREIYEGDIVKVENDVRYLDKYISIVKWEDCYLGFKIHVKSNFLFHNMYQPKTLFLHEIDKSEIKILGNIYEHPELLSSSNG